MWVVNVAALIGRPVWQTRQAELLADDDLLAKHLPCWIHIAGPNDDSISGSGFPCRVGEDEDPFVGNFTLCIV